MLCLPELESNPQFIAFTRMCHGVTTYKLIYKTSIHHIQFHSYLDFINVMAYDFHGKWERETGHNAPLYAPSSDSEWRKQLSVDHAAHLWVKLGAPKEKLIIGEILSIYYVFQNTLSSIIDNFREIVC